MVEPDTEILDELLDKLLSAKLGVGAAVLVSREGLPIASAISRCTDETRITSITSALFSLGRMSVIEMKNGNFDQICIKCKGSEGYIIVVPVGDFMIMLLSTTKQIEKLDSNFFTRLGPFNPPGSSGATATAEKELYWA